MKYMLMLAMVLGVAACAKKTEPEPAPEAAKEMAPGKLEVGLKGDIVVERIGETGADRTDQLWAELALKNVGDKDLTVKKVDYTVMTGTDRTEPKLWDAEQVTVGGGKTESLKVPVKLTWTGAGDFPHKEANFDGTITYTTDGQEKTEAFKVTGAVVPKAP